MDAAEFLFIRRNIESVSIRDITSRAKVSVSSINYHFGNKQELIKAVFLRRIEPMNKSRLELLEFFERQAQKTHQPLSLEAILCALIYPMAERGLPKERHHYFMQLLGRSFAEANSKVEALLHHPAGKIQKRFDAALSQAEPKLTKEQLQWKISFMMGSLYHSLLLYDRLDRKAKPAKHPIKKNKYLQQLITFLAAGFRA